LKCLEINIVEYLFSQINLLSYLKHSLSDCDDDDDVEDDILDRV